MSSHSVDPAQPQPESFAFTPEMRAKADVIIARYPEGRQRSAVLPLLDLAQRQAGWLSRAAMDHVAEVLALPNIRVYEVATFYTMYRLRPVGRVHVQLCTSISCALRDSDGVMRAAEEVFGIPFGQSNADCTLEEVECAGACVNGPAHSTSSKVQSALDAPWKKSNAPGPASTARRRKSAMITTKI